MPATQYRWTTAEVRALMDESRPWPRYELLGGELVVTPAPGRPHQLAVTEIWLALQHYVDEQGVGVTFVSPADLELLPGTITQPDVFVVPTGRGESAKPMRDWSDTRSLLLAIEVISPSSVRTDRVEKRDHYLRAGVPEYWVADVDARLIERWYPERETPLVLQTTLEWQPSGASAPLTINLIQLFRTIWGKFAKAGGE